MATALGNQVSMDTSERDGRDARMDMDEKGRYGEGWASRAFGSPTTFLPSDEDGQREWKRW